MDLRKHSLRNNSALPQQSTLSKINLGARINGVENTQYAENYGRNSRNAKKC